MQPIYQDNMVFLPPYRDAAGRLYGGGWVPDPFGPRYVGDRPVSMTVYTNSLRLRLLDTKGTPPGKPPRTVFRIARRLRRRQRRPAAGGALPGARGVRRLPRPERPGARREIRQRNRRRDQKITGRLFEPDRQPLERAGHRPGRLHFGMPGLPGPHRPGIGQRAGGDDVAGPQSRRARRGAQLPHKCSSACTGPSSTLAPTPWSLSTPSP